MFSALFSERNKPPEDMRYTDFMAGFNRFALPGPDNALTCDK